MSKLNTELPKQYTGNTNLNTPKFTKFKFSQWKRLMDCFAKLGYDF